MGHGKTSYVCLECRIAFKLPYAGPGAAARTCPGCARPMVHAGSALAVPRRQDTEGWRVLSVLLRSGVRFHKSCCGGPGYRPRTLREVRARMAHSRATGEPLAEALVRYEVP